MKQYRISAETNIGNKKKKNRDNFFCNGIYKNIEEEVYSCNCQLSSYVLNVAGVFDGMEGEVNGEMASYIIAQLFEKYAEVIREKEKMFHPQILFNKINEYICQESDRLSVKLGVTAVLLVCGGMGARVCNVGKNKAFLYRNGFLREITVNSAKETTIQYLGNRQTGVLIDPFDSGWIPIQEKDIFLLCSDGLTAELTDVDIWEILSKDITLWEKRKILIERAIKSGGNDNITVALIEI